MLKKRILVGILSVILIVLLVIYNSIGEDNSVMVTRLFSASNDRLVSGYVNNDLKVVEFDINKKESLDKSNDAQTEEVNKKEDNIDIKADIVEEEKEEVQEEVHEEVVKEEPKIVYDGMTLEELANKLERSFNNELSGKGYLYASYSLEKGVDPYLAAAISLEETGCKWNCSSLVKNCNNVGGMKGSGCGAYGYFGSLDDGIRAFIDNIYRNYVAYGLTTANTMHHKYAENPEWANNVNAYINRIKNA